MRKLFVPLCLLLACAGMFMFTRAPFPGSMGRIAAGQVNYAGDIAYYTHGQGPRVVLLASAGRQVSDFNELVKSLVDEGYRTVAVEAPGIGGTPIPSGGLDMLAAQVKTVIDKDNQSNTKSGNVILGHAFGNRVARTYAAKYPDDVNGVILIAAGGDNEIEEKAGKALKSIFNPIVSTKGRRKHIRTAFFAPDNEIPEHWKTGWHTETAQYQGKIKNDAGGIDWQAAGTAPILVVQALQDRVAPKEVAAARLKSEYPSRVTVTYIDEAGHALLPEQPALIKGAVLDFLQTHHPIR